MGDPLPGVREYNVNKRIRERTGKRRPLPKIEHRRKDDFNTEMKRNDVVESIALNEGMG